MRRLLCVLVVLMLVVPVWAQTPVYPPPVPKNFSGQTAKSPPTGNDIVPINDSAASYVLKKLTLTALSSWLTGASGTVVGLQAATPGTQQTGNLNINGVGIFGTGITGNVTGNVSGSSGSCTGNAATATALATARAINGVNFDGSAAITVPVNNADDHATNATMYPLWTATQGGDYAAKTSSGLTYNPSTGTLTATTFAGALTGTASGNLVSGGALGTPSSGTLTNCTFPTLNQPTTGTSGGVINSGAATIQSGGGAGLLFYDVGSGGTTFKVDTVYSSQPTIAFYFNGKYKSDGSLANFGSVTGYKENTTDNDYAGALAFSTRANGGALTQYLKIASTGIVQMAHYGVGAASFDASGNLVSASDPAMKDIKGVPVYGLQEVLQINPILYKWKKGMGLDTEHTYIGFNAQEIKNLIPEAVGKNKDGMLSLDDKGIIVALVNAVKEQQAQIEALKAKVK